MKTLQPSEPQLAVALLVEGGCLVTGFRIPLGSAIEEVTSPPRGPFLGLTVDSPAHSPRGPDRSSVIHAAPGLTVAPHSPPHSSQASCVCSSELTDLGPDSPPVSHLFSILDESLSLKACQCPRMHTHGLLGMSSDIGGTRPGKYGHPCLRQAVPPAPVYYSYYLPHICPSSDPNPQSLFNISVSVHG